MQFQEKLNKINELQEKKKQIDKELEALLTNNSEGTTLTTTKWNVLKMKPEFTAQYLYDECKNLFNSVTYFDDLSSTKSDRSGEYEITFEANVEADERWKYKSAEDLAKLKDIKFITLEERLLLEIQYFKETGKHLDIDSWTLCSGSRDHDGSVPFVSWNENQFPVYYCNPGNANDVIRTRSAV